MSGIFYGGNDALVGNGHPAFVLGVTRGGNSEHTGMNAGASHEPNSMQKFAQHHQ
ncbi:hypothetical protein GGR92_004026 [Spirosoma lacussanchae]